MAGDTGSVKKIDTKNFQEAINGFESAVKKYRVARERVFDSTEKLLYDWEGKGKNSFEKQYGRLKTQLKDEEDNLFTIKEDLQDCMKSYVDWDTQLAGQLKPPAAKPAVPKKPYTPPVLGGNNNPFIGSNNNQFNGGSNNPVTGSSNNQFNSGNGGGGAF
ncbi:WXG100 family type VII secretion target [Clostridium estertheticum]|uniref:WXG100 family type VII secretion target n=1 Tax=Clostridium estertheticum TaxID=238834 RepID=UPI001C0BE1E6|nr:WXG100 family type VII secretion target [Clostridium estertheticum]MBU3215891.1 WXG100 family type VII secretion target [Clostridium estertheticum]WAG54121.1 WXG100 family type VII secretion target [Clostridium estertheticum]